MDDKLSLGLCFPHQILFPCSKFPFILKIILYYISCDILLLLQEPIIILYKTKYNEILCFHSYTTLDINGICKSHSFLPLNGLWQHAVILSHFVQNPTRSTFMVYWKVVCLYHKLNSTISKLLLDFLKVSLNFIARSLISHISWFSVPRKNC